MGVAGFRQPGANKAGHDPHCPCPVLPRHDEQRRTPGSAGFVPSSGPVYVCFHAVKKLSGFVDIILLIPHTRPLVVFAGYPQTPSGHPCFRGSQQSQTISKMVVVKTKKPGYSNPKPFSLRLT